MGKNICRILKEADVGSVGIGAMIVFIAMVLVAGIAASVLVQTANRLEIQAMQTGSETTAEVATGIAVYDIEGHVATDIDYLAIMVGGRAGSAELDLSEAYIEISDTSMKNVLKYIRRYNGAAVVGAPLAPKNIATACVPPTRHGASHVIIVSL